MNAGERMSFSNLRTSKTRFATSFVLQPDISNKYKYSSAVKDTVVMANSIPFLRDHRNTDNLQFVNGKFDQLDIYGPISPTVGNRSINLLKGAKAR